MFRLFQTIIKALLVVMFIIISPLCFMISMVFANSFREAFKATVEMVLTPFDE